MAEDMDLVLHVGSEANAETLEAKSSVLQDQSAWFKTILSGRWALKKTQDGKLIIKLPKDDPEDFRLFLKLLNEFTGLSLESDDDFETVAAIQELADRYEVAKLQKNLIEWFDIKVAEKVTPVTLIQFYNKTKDKVIKGLREAICKFVARHTYKFWKSKEWLDLDEFAIQLIFSDDKTFHEDASEVCKQRSFSTYGCRGCPFVSWDEGDDIVQEQIESKNELLILQKAIEWLNHQTKKVTIPRSNENETQELTLKVLQHVRFRRMMYSDLGGAIDRAQHLLTDLQIGQIFRSKLNGEGAQTTLAFKPDYQQRNLPRKQYKRKFCSQCRHVSLFIKLEEGEEGFDSDANIQHQYVCGNCDCHW